MTLFNLDQHTDPERPAIKTRWYVEATNTKDNERYIYWKSTADTYVWIKVSSLGRRKPHRWKTAAAAQRFIERYYRECLSAVMVDTKVKRWFCE